MLTTIIVIDSIIFTAGATVWTTIDTIGVAVIFIGVIIIIVDIDTIVIILGIAVAVIITIIVSAVVAAVIVVNVADTIVVVPGVELCSRNSMPLWIATQKSLQ